MSCEVKMKVGASMALPRYQSHDNGREKRVLGIVACSLYSSEQVNLYRMVGEGLVKDSQSLVNARTKR